MDISCNKETLLDENGGINKQLNPGRNDRLYYDAFNTQNRAIINKYIDPKYIDDPVYLSMKLPSEAVSSYLPSRRNGTTDSQWVRPQGYNHAIGIGAIYSSDPSLLPDKFNVYFGRFTTYTLGMDKSARWVKHEDYKFPPFIMHYTLPWQTSKSTSIPVEKHEEYAKITVTREQLSDGVIHFFGGNNSLFDVGNTRAMICIYEVWTDCEEAKKSAFCTIGIDQRVAGDESKKVVQLFSGRNIMLRTDKTIHVGHNISDEDYELLVEAGNNPKTVYNNFLYSMGTRVEVDYKKMIPEKYLKMFTSLMDLSKSETLEYKSVKYEATRLCDLVFMDFALPYDGKTKTGKTSFNSNERVICNFTYTNIYKKDSICQVIVEFNGNSFTVSGLPKDYKANGKIHLDNFVVL